MLQMDARDGRLTASMGRSIPAVIGCAAKKICFESIGYYSISPKFADHMDLRLVLLLPKLKEPVRRKKLAIQGQFKCSETMIRTRWSFVILQYRIRLHKHVSYHSSGRRRAIYLALASLTLIRGRARSSLRRWLCSIRRLNFSSDIDCRPPVRVLMMALKS
jgi:hypothetical protein